MKRAGQAVEKKAWMQYYGACLRFFRQVRIQTSANPFTGLAPAPTVAEHVLSRSLITAARNRRKGGFKFSWRAAAWCWATLNKT